MMTCRANLFLTSLFSVTMISGCALTTPADVEKSVYKPDNELKISNIDLVNNMRVDEIEDFYDTASVITPERIANLNNEDFRSALTLSLSNANLYSTDGSYAINAKLTDPDISFLFNRSYKREPTVTYTIRDNMGKVIYNENITSIGRSDPFFIHSEYKHNKITAEKAYKDSFRQLIEDISAL